MRVPIYPVDLAHSQGFKSIAKKLKTNWCGASPITLGFAQELLAQALGYRGFYDLQELAKVSEPGQPAPPEPDVRQAVLNAIKDGFKPDQNLLPDSESLIRLVQKLPIDSLLAYRARNERKQHSEPGSRAGARKIDNSHRLATPHPELLNQEELRRIEAVVAASSNLRDKALLACLEGGMRGHQCLSVRAGHTMKGRDFHALAVPDKSDQIIIVQSAAVSEYAITRKLESKDFLFSSPHHPTKPMSEHTLRRICASWASKANVRDGLITPNEIRVAAIRTSMFSTSVENRPTFLIQPRRR